MVNDLRYVYMTMQLSFDMLLLKQKYWVWSWHISMQFNILCVRSIKVNLRGSYNSLYSAAGACPHAIHLTV